MSDWQVGDGALCVDGRPCPVHCVITGIVEGRSYIVSAVRPGLMDTDGKIRAGLRFVELVAPLGGWFNENRFQKSPRHEADEFDREVIEQMNGAPVGEAV
jgi:hypothetical protein